MKRLMLMVFALGMYACAADPVEDGSEQQSLSEVEMSAKLEIPKEKAKAMKEAARAARSGDPVPLHAACGTSGPNLDQTIHRDAPVSGAVNQRSGTIALSSTNCPILGVLQETDDAEYFCWTVGNDGFTWTYLRSLRDPFVRGWSRDNLLDGFGAIHRCPF